MEVLKVGAAMVLALTVASCELVSPSDFAQAVADAGITPLLVQSVETWDTLSGGQSVEVVGFVGGGGKVWIITTAGFYGYDAETLDLRVAQKFAAALPLDTATNRFDDTHWNYAVSGTTELLWCRVLAPTGSGYAYEILTIHTAGGSSALTHANGDVPVALTIGNKAGTGWQIQADPSVPSFQFNDTAGAGLVGLVDTVSSQTFGNLRTSPEVLYAISDLLPYKEANRRFIVRVVEWPISVWGTFIGHTTETYDVTLPPRFAETYWANSSTYAFDVLKAKGRTYLMPLFGADSGNRTTTSVVVLDDATGQTLASQFVGGSARVAVEAGDGWFLLGPEQYFTASQRSEPLRKYRW